MYIYVYIRYIEAVKTHDEIGKQMVKDAAANGGRSDMFILQSSIIKKIIDEHHMFTPLAFLRDSLGLLQKAIMITYCKHFKATGGDMDMTADMIWMRLQRLVLWLQEESNKSGLVVDS